MASDAPPLSDSFIASNATILGDVTLDQQVSIWFGAVIRADKDRVGIGRRSNVQDNAVIHTSSGHPVEIGEDVSVGHGAILHGCAIGDRVLIGMGAIVMNGAIVGEDTIVGAAALITEGTKIPPRSVVLGVPGKVIRETTEEERAHILENAIGYHRLAGKYQHA
ncbi:MAG TPA: gamma carbonic anhydrase family protein [Methanomicrobiales archaeon]|nr:gamma carbonic anhydrase family protein [Methanomicrobiales archaeon]